MLISQLHAKSIANFIKTLRKTGRKMEKRTLKLQELSEILEEILPSKGVSDYCPNGLQVEGKGQVSAVATAVSANLETIEKAIEKGVDALIVHHGLFWKQDKQEITGSLKKKIERLLFHQISLFAYHLPLDSHRVIGNNWRAASDLGWQELEPFGFFNGVAVGVKGRIKATKRSDVQNQLQTYYCQQAHCALGGKKEIETLALISGGAYKSLAEAAKEGIDCFITGNFDEPVWHQAFEEKINFFLKKKCAFF